jgi:uncharacterized protein YehS (DUF1456 family)
MMAIFASAELKVTREQVSAWLKKEDDTGYVNCNDSQLASFLNGLINEKRGKKDGAKVIPEKRLTNNIILTKLKIAFNLKAEDIIELLEKVNYRISKPELSAFSRKPDHKHYRECKDQILRNFLQGLDNLHHVKRRAKVATEKYSEKNNQDSQEKEVDFHQGPKKSYGTATPKASKIYVNPNRTVVEKPKSSRKTLKLKPEDIWGKQD